MRWLMVLATLLSTVALAANPQVTLDTSKGEIVLELYPDKAPATVANFLTYVQDGFYNGTVFHRIIPNFMIQGGGFDQQYQKKDTRDAIQNEADNGLGNDRGTIAMARTGDPHSATAQFFINTVDNTPLNFTGKNPRGWGYAVFGKVIKGMDVVDAISATPTGLGK
ncbi:MAG: peptidylprolyl isomerase, partial [Alcanivoracaceae bacterium]|nr:peptidylprolyl isomerase [Alcanivoracaceae bacterium]